MSSKTINTPKIVVLFIGIVILLIPAVSASKGNVYQNNEAKTVANEISYDIFPAEGSPSGTDDSYIYPQSTGSVKRGTCAYSYINLGTGVKSLEVNLEWLVLGNSLSLNIKSPSGKDIGTYFDCYDKKIDGKIHLFVYPTTGYMEQGLWMFTIKGESVSGTTSQSYRITFYTH
jgi:hypothetical protein